MKKLSKKIVSALFALTLALSAVPVSADGSFAPPTSTTLYLSPGAYQTTHGLYLYDMPSGQKVTSVKSSDTKVAAVSRVSNSKSKTDTETKYYDGQKDSKSSDTSTSADIYLSVKKAGTANVTYKVGKKSYKTKVTVKKYTNPVKSITVSGVNGGKNFASKTNKATYVDGIKVTKANKKAQISISAKSGWKITNASFSDRESENDYSNYSNYSFSNYSTKGVSSCNIYVPLEKKKGDSLTVTFQNKKDGGSITVSYHFS